MLAQPSLTTTTVCVPLHFAAAKSAARARCQELATRQQRKLSRATEATALAKAAAADAFRRLTAKAASHVAATEHSDCPGPDRLRDKERELATARATLAATEAAALAQADYHKKHTAETAAEAELYGHGGRAGDASFGDVDVAPAQINAAPQAVLERLSQGPLPSAPAPGQSG